MTKRNKILCIETSGKACSGAIFEENKPLAHFYIETSNYQHSEKLHTQIQEILQKTGCTLQEIDLLSVSEGPGSYTGIRIGLAALQGLAFVLKKPVIVLNSLEILAGSKKEIEEVYACIDAKNEQYYIGKIKNGFLEANPYKEKIENFKSIYEQNPLPIIANIPQKELIFPENSFFVEKIAAVNMGNLVLEKHKQKKHTALQEIRGIYL